MFEQFSHDILAKRVLVAGFGVEGESAARFFLGSNAHVTVHDKKQEGEFDGQIVRALKEAGASFQFGSELPEGEFDIFVRSPGISPNTQIMQWAHDSGISMTSATELFLELCQGTVIGVTGTKGKGTTSSLIAAILKEDGRETYIGGNIGTPALSFLDNVTSSAFVILELSSFQLMDIQRSPHIAVVLMTTSEHLDFHADEKEYVDAKTHIVAFQKADDIVVSNSDYENSRQIALASHGIKYEVSNSHTVSQGCFVAGGDIVWRAAGQDEIVSLVADVKLPGRHNLENVCAAIAAAKAVGVSTDAVKRALVSFTGLEHRLEFVAEINGVKYYNDSFSTTPESAIAAIRSFHCPKVLILGGSYKGSDFSALAQTIIEEQPVRAIIGIGEEWTRIKEALISHHALETVTNIIEEKQTMQEIVKAAAIVAQHGDVVILSPACASFGLFKNYKERGELFKEAIRLIVRQ